MARVLVIEDRHNIRKFVSINLSARGYLVEEAADGREGLEKLRRNRPDVLLLDIKMPRMSGLDVLKAMARDPQLRSIPVIVMTASSANLDDGHQYDNVEQILVKPLSVPDLVSMVGEVLSKREGRQ